MVEVAWQVSTGLTGATKVPLLVYFGTLEEWLYEELSLRVTGLTGVLDDLAENEAEDTG